MSKSDTTAIVIPVTDPYACPSWCGRQDPAVGYLAHLPGDDDNDRQTHSSTGTEVRLSLEAEGDDDEMAKLRVYVARDEDRADHFVVERRGGGEPLRFTPAEMRRFAEVCLTEFCTWADATKDTLNNG